MDLNHKRYIKEFSSSMAAYTIVVYISVWLLKHRVHSPLRFLVAVLPVVPAVLAMWAAIRYFPRARRTTAPHSVRRLAFSFLATCLIALSWGFLQNAGLPRAM